jgi:hypothetical protein
MEKNTDRMQTLLRNLKIANGSDSIKLEEIAVVMLLNSLPPEYASLRSVLENYTSSPNLNETQDKIIMEFQTKAIKENASIIQPDSIAVAVAAAVAAAGFRPTKRMKSSPKPCAHFRNKEECFI